MVQKWRSPSVLSPKGALGSPHSFRRRPVLPPKGSPKGSPSCPGRMWQGKIPVVAGPDVCCGRTRSLLWLDKSSGVARHTGSPFVEEAEGRLPYVLPQQTSCLATAEILSCHSRDLVLPQHTSGPATTGILPCHIRPEHSPPILRHPGKLFPPRLTIFSRKYLISKKVHYLSKRLLFYLKSVSFPPRLP